MNTPDMLDCGHLNTYKLEERSKPGYTGGTGYATTQENKRICYACAAAQIAEELKREGRGALYFVSVGAYLTDWAGVLQYPARGIRQSRGVGFYGREYRITTGRFTGPDGALWSFHNAGRSQVAHCRRLKKQK